MAIRTNKVNDKFISRLPMVIRIVLLIKAIITPIKPKMIPAKNANPAPILAPIMQPSVWVPSHCGGLRGGVNANKEIITPRIIRVIPDINNFLCFFVCVIFTK